MPDDVKKSGEQKAAEADIEGFREDLGPFVVAAETTRMPMVFTDAKAAGHPIIFVNEAFLKLTGYEEHEVLAQSFDFLVERNADPEALREIQTAFGGARDLSTQVCCRRKDGSVFWVVIFISPVRDGSGAVVQHFASFADVTRHKEEEDRLRFLLDELNHRVQNTLVTVLAIVGQTLQHVADREAVGLVEGRILALARGHSLLGSKDWERVGLRDVISQILRPFGLDDPQVARFSVRGDDARLQPKTALTLAMVFHELATNATKYGALSGNAAGRVDIDWQVEMTLEGERMRLRWQESGGPPVSPPSRKGFGSRLIERGLAQDLDGEVHLDYEPAGVICRIVMPLPKMIGE